ncbi:unnamed protein product [Cyclocybe aegerita]|uniref:Uncharacterized protein n=1 Tax=Cyclocybe aegerita TaxID=1973307 RepID=A0A8S0WF05_CYCAE|nr:unnamed protein product [Cyclocybe aegerita]
MAAVVEHPTSAFSDRQGPIQQPPRMSSLEIIDVEEYLQEAQASNAGISSSQPTRPTPRPILRNSGRQQETIYIDSDDDEPVITFSRVLSGHEANGQRSHRRLISPPPRSSSGSVPPVPPIPGPFAGHTAFPPMRRNPPAFPQPPVVANESLDIEFLSDLPVAGPSAFTSRVVHRRGTGAGPPGPPPLPAAPASHHTPSMGLGGALISSNSARARQEAQDARIAARIARQRQAGRAPVIRGLPAPPYLFHEDGRAQVRSVWGLGHFSSLGWPFSGPSSGKEKEMYNPSYTHPGQPEPGFTFDFSVSEEDAPRRPGFPTTSIHAPIVIDDSDDEPSSSDRPVVIDVDSVPAKTTVATTTSMAGSKTATSGTGELSALLVCARCCDPLILNAAMDPEEGYYRRVWALRCGHMIDEKCLNEIGQPPEARLVQMEMEEMVNEKEKEKEKEEEQEPKMEKKGKGKAKARTTAMSSDTVPEVKEAEDNNIRARLRSRNPTVGASSTPPSSITATIAPSTTTTTTISSTVAMASSTASSSSSSTTTSINHPASKRRRVGPKSRRPPHVEDEYVWTCPVASCGRVHASVKVDGIWCPEKEGFVGPEGAMRAVQEGREIVPRGVIAVFA